MVQRRAKATAKRKSGLRAQKSRGSKAKSSKTATKRSPARTRAKATSKARSEAPSKAKRSPAKRRSLDSQSASAKRRSTTSKVGAKVATNPSVGAASLSAPADSKPARWPFEVGPQVDNPKLTPTQTREMKTLLESERSRLVQEITSLAGQNYTELNATRSNRFGNHLADVASDNQLLETILVQSGIEADRLRQVNEALDRIRRRRYGVCERCGGNIGHARLLAKPFARFCIACREVLEQASARVRR